MGRRDGWLEGFTLQVTVPGAEPYLVAQRFKVPKKAENLGFSSIGNKIPAGVELPVRVDPRDAGRVEIEWELWMGSPGRKQAMRDGRASAAMAWAEAVQLGDLTREQFEQQLTLEVDHGRMDPADAAAARATLDG